MEMSSRSLRSLEYIPIQASIFLLYGPVLNRSQPIKRINLPDLDQIPYLMAYYPINFKFQVKAR